MRIAIYSRKSIETDTGESIQNQIKLCKQYFERQYSDCHFEIFEDEGFSGGNINRPDFKRMMDLVKIKQFDVVTVYKIDRIARNIVDFVNVFDELERYNVKLVSITEGFDPSTPAGKMMMMLLASFAEMERMNIAQRVKDNMRELAKLGRWSGGTAPFGYTAMRVEENGKHVSYLKLKDNMADIIISIFKQYSEGHSCIDISRLLKQKGIDLPKKTIEVLLKNPVYLISSNESAKYLETIGYQVYGDPNGKGFLPYNQRPRTKGVKSYKDKNRFVAVSNHEAVISLDLFIAVQNEFKGKYVAPHPHESNFTFLSGGIMKCKCGASMEVGFGHVRKDGTRKYYFKCSNSCGCKFIEIPEAEKKVLDFLKHLSNKEFLTTIINSTKKIKENKKDSKLITKKIKENDIAINNLVNKLALLSNEVSKIVTDKIEQLSKENNNLKEELMKLEREKLFEKFDSANIDLLSNQIGKFLNLGDDIEEKRILIKNIFKSIVWNPDTNTLTFFINI